MSVCECYVFLKGEENQPITTLAISYTQLKIPLAWKAKKRKKNSINLFDFLTILLDQFTHGLMQYYRNHLENRIGYNRKVFIGLEARITVFD